MKKQQVVTNYSATAKINPSENVVITKSNQPMVYRAGNPVVITDPSHGGVPFISHYGTEQGLPLNNVICSTTDARGNIWLGTGGGGVSRFDGRNFTNYTTAQGLAANVVFAIQEDGLGNLWFATTAGISKFDGYKFSTYTAADGLAENFVSCIMLDRSGQLWFGTHEGGVSRFDGKRFTTYNRASGLLSNYVRCLLQDKPGKIWLGTDGGGLSCFDGSRFLNYGPAQGLAAHTVNCLRQDKTGRLWLGTDAGVSVFDGKRFTNYTTAQGLPDDAVYSIAEDGAGDMWFGTGTNGLSKFNRGRFITDQGSAALPPGKINSMVLDNDKNLWFSSQGGGLNKFERPDLTYYTKAQGLAGDLVFSIAPDQQGNLWFGTYEGGVSKFDGKRFTNYTAAQGLGDNIIWSILCDGAGDMWFGTDRAGVSKFDGKSFTRYTIAQGLPSNSVISILQDGKGNYWFGTRKNGLSRFDGHRFTNYTTAQGLPGNNIQKIAQDKAGHIWVATHDNGISEFDGWHFTNYGIAQGLISNNVGSLLVDKEGHIWVATDKGLSEYDGHKFTNYTTTQGLPDNYITEITEDQKMDKIWVGTNKGLCGFGENPAGDDDGPPVFEIFNKATGYSLEDVSTSGLCVDKTGVVWMGSGAGKLIRFDPAMSGQVKKTTPLVLEIHSVRINNENVGWNSLLRKTKGDDGPDSLTLLNEEVTAFGRSLSPRMRESLNQRFSGIGLDSVKHFYPVPMGLVLPYGDNNISFDFAAIAAASGKLVKYQYKLEGYSKQWSPLNNTTTATFGNLSSGTYTLQVKALSPRGVWSHLAYRFRVLPPWWLTWWAELLYLLTGGGLLFGFYRNRIGILQRRQAAQIHLMVATQENERGRISRELHDEVGVKLSALKLQLSALYEKTFRTGQEDIRLLAQNSGDLIGEVMQDVRQLLHELSPRVLEEFGYLTAVEGLIGKINESQKMQITLTAFGMELRLKKDHELALYRMTQELINNVLKHAAASEVFLEIGRRDGQLILMIADDGKGFDPASQKDGYGLHNLATRTNLLRGELHIDSSPGKGTSILIRIPYNPQ